MPLLQLIRSANVLTTIKNDRPYSLISKRLNTEQTGMLSRNRGMCERQPQVLQTSKNHHPSPPCKSELVCYSRDVIPVHVRHMCKRPGKEGLKTRVVICSIKQGTSKYRRPLATIYLQGQDCQGTARYGTRLVGLSACALSKKMSRMEAPQKGW